ncbi:MAG: hypothetical protein GOV15_03500 [Candidatus Diapherotrites archaeon]|nr:hypothetical protein [Candidatus Diapherotrites archaeon]
MYQLHLDDSHVIKHAKRDLEKSTLAVIGVGFDSTSTEVPGQRFAPNYIRDWFSKLYGNDTTSEKNVYNTNFADLGNIEVEHGSYALTNDKVQETIQAAYETQPKLKLVTLGGEHSITHAMVTAVSKKHKVDLIVFDAHADMLQERNDVTHINFLKHLIEDKIVNSVTIIGVRAWTKEEKVFADKNKVKLITMSKLADVKKIKGKTVYLSIDIDVLDPIYCPGTGSPEPLGMSYEQLLDLVEEVTKNNEVVGADIVEVLPHLDNGVTGLHAANLLKKLILWM